MHYTSITTTFLQSQYCRIKGYLPATLLLLLITPALSTAEVHHEKQRVDRTISTGSPDIIIKEDYPSGDRIMQVKPQKQPEQNNNQNSGQNSLLLIDIKPDISKYTK